uniref:Groucho/TLE N-terminal Q-rich domain-containing protein n=1 Tax=Castor canadensis TaxID=51338 RepID=A0A8C0XLE9_CASCN
MIRDLSKMYPQTRHPAPHQPAQPFKFTISESCDRIKEEFQFLQAQYHSLKLECEKLASEKTEMQRHYVMYYEMSYGLNIEMHKQVSYYFFNYHFKWKNEYNSGHSHSKYCII